MSDQPKPVFSALAAPVVGGAHFGDTHAYIQHGNTSVFWHSVAVAYYSDRLAARLRLRVHRAQMIRGALLHDYFLYDWHRKEEGHRLHGFYHARTALENAVRDYALGEIERDIIRKHMFPLTLYPPRYRESVIVCLVDKACSLYEIVRRDAYDPLRQQLAALAEKSAKSD